MANVVGKIGAHTSKALGKAIPILYYHFPESDMVVLRAEDIHAVARAFKLCHIVFIESLPV